MKVYKSSKVTILRSVFLGLTLGLFSAVFIFIVTLFLLKNPSSSNLSDLFESIFPCYQMNFSGLFWGPIWGFVYGLILGALIGEIYNWLIKKKLDKVKQQIFEFDPTKSLNTIQEGIGDNPFTIAIVANPVIRVTSFMITDKTLTELRSNGVPDDVVNNLASCKDTKKTGWRKFLDFLKQKIDETPINDYQSLILEYSNNGDDFVQDPIMNNRDLFHKVVIRCLRSFVNNELLGNPEIFHRLKIVTVFDEKNLQLVNNQALCNDIPGTYILCPRREVELIKKYVDDYIEPTDVTFVISASENQIISATRFTIDKDNGHVDFKFTFTDDLSIFDKKIHTFHAELPGIVALSAWDDRLKTPVHEFAHAVSSLENGVIDDEYVDETHPSLQFIINKKFREYFRITKNTLDELKIAGVNETVLTKLPILLNKDYEGRAAFLKVLDNTINDPTLFDESKVPILRYARYLRSFMITTQTLDDLRLLDVPNEIIGKIEGLKNYWFRNQLEFLAEIDKAINDLKAYEDYKTLIAKYAEIEKPVKSIPDLFAKYQLDNGEVVEYNSDRDRRDKDPSWLSYVPERIIPRISCSMDIAYFGFRYDKLIFDFIYDRLFAKLNRP